MARPRGRGAPAQQGVGKWQRVDYLGCTRQADGYHCAVTTWPGNPEDPALIARSRGGKKFEKTRALSGKFDRVEVQGHTTVRHAHNGLGAIQAHVDACRVTKGRQGRTLYCREGR